MLHWVNHPGAYWQADIGDGSSYRNFPVHRSGFELWLWN